MKKENRSLSQTLVDDFGRRVSYVRLSVTDRCDFRCVYCMAEEMTFLPRQQILSLEELGLVGRAFTELGVSKIRLTGGEPLVRKDILHLVEELGSLSGLEQLNLTTNGSRLERFAKPLVEAGVKRVNISLDSVDPARFKQLTRTGDLDLVVRGIDAVREAGFERIRLNAVILKNRNDDEVLPLVDFARERQLDLAFIEEMPLGNIVEHDRSLAFCASQELRERIEKHYPLHSIEVETNGPARYFGMEDSPSRIGFISPHSENFCHLCNRVRVTVEGRLLLCLGNEHSVDLRETLRRYPGEIEPLKQAIVEAMHLKPEKHHFDLDEEPDIVRFMNMTGG